MSRPQLHLSETMLDAARERDELLARLWLRAVYRSQASFLAALETEDPREAALAAAMSIIHFCEAEPADARLLASFRREDLIRTTRDELANELEVLRESGRGMLAPSPRSARVRLHLDGLRPPRLARPRRDGLARAVRSGHAGLIELGA
jgi:hypothetical protein